MNNEVMLPASTLSSICDFCSGPKIHVIYPARTFNAWLEKLDGNKMNLISESDWGACKACAFLIDANLWDALVERSLLWFRMKYGAALPEAELRTAIIELHRRFRENREQTH